MAHEKVDFKRLVTQQVWLARSNMELVININNKSEGGIK